MRRTLGLAVAALLTFADTSSAQEETGHEAKGPLFVRPGWYLAGGANFALLDSGTLQGPLGGSKGFGPGANMRVGYRFANRIAVEFESNWMRHKAIGNLDSLRLPGDLESQLFFDARATVPGSSIKANKFSGQPRVNWNQPSANNRGKVVGVQTRCDTNFASLDFSGIPGFGTINFGCVFETSTGGRNQWSGQEIPTNPTYFAVSEPVDPANPNTSEWVPIDDPPPSKPNGTLYSDVIQPADPENPKFGLLTKLWCNDRFNVPKEQTIGGTTSITTIINLGCDAPGESPHYTDDPVIAVTTSKELTPINPNFNADDPGSPLYLPPPGNQITRNPRTGMPCSGLATDSQGDEACRDPDTSLPIDNIPWPSTGANANTKKDAFNVDPLGAFLGRSSCPAQQPYYPAVIANPGGADDGTIANLSLKTYSYPQGFNGLNYVQQESGLFNLFMCGPLPDYFLKAPATRRQPSEEGNPFSPLETVRADFEDLLLSDNGQGVALNGTTDQPIDPFDRVRGYFFDKDGLEAKPPDTKGCPNDDLRNPLTGELVDASSPTDRPGKQNTDCRKRAVNPKEGLALYPTDELHEIRSDTLALTVNLRGYLSNKNGWPAMLGPFSDLVDESTLRTLSLGGRIQPFVLVGGGVGLTNVYTSATRLTRRDEFFNITEDVDAQPFCDFLLPVRDQAGDVHMVRFGPACNGSEHRFPAGGLRETLIEENFEATVVLKGGFGIDFYATRQLAVSVEGRFDWIEGFGSVPLDLSVSLLYRF